ncbi:peptide-methionine (S)-S-oxide reductase MsrA [Opitutus terrae]|uniref:Peptide methionine sulfoxide reductase MsrA n=1 Tax=Opitutus terrae (strain DSM 11246 / JCM 15787 / PB90-1) TaxID=452637 RepID=B1ZQ77_OPITP|nr:peptide-methionine (S)-S-oxide reductase MsrA [Opitutus terrae]ACB73557.1 peptide methionine sulfoxide reductase [Opitutus terrae PB90-1]
MKRLFTLLALAGLVFPMAHAAETKTESIVLGGGCFWCTEAAYELLPGVKNVVSGYAGGHQPNPNYEQVCGHGTGHAEVIKIDYDPAQVSLDEVLDYFWHVHNPTQVGGQGNDRGPQYRSIILYANEAQKTAAEKSKAKAAEEFRDPITTEIVPLEKFWVAEDYHQDYFRKNPNQGYCALVIAPKIRKLQKQVSAAGK